jgi:hypothetical protein
MQNEYYKLFGLTPDASNEELDLAYNALKSKYKNEMFAEGEQGNIAAEKLTALENAYKEIKSERETKDINDGFEKNNYIKVEELIKDGKLSDAQAKLDSYNVRDAEWHYLQAIIFYKKNWNNESKKQLEIAMSIEPSNERYKTAYEKLDAKTKQAESSFRSGNANFDNNPQNQMQGPQMGASFCSTCADCCTMYCCTSLFCNTCCR